jgi:hypothetical protein
MEQWWNDYWQGKADMIWRINPTEVPICPYFPDSEASQSKNYEHRREQILKYF